MMKGKFFTKKNMKNWRWWVGAFVFILILIALSPVFIAAGFVAALDKAIYFVLTPVDISLSWLVDSIGKWIREGQVK